MALWLRLPSCSPKIHFQRIWENRAGLMAALSSRCPRGAAGPAYLQEVARSAHWASPPLVPLRMFQNTVFSSGSFHSGEEEEEVSLLRMALVGQGPVPLFLGSLSVLVAGRGPQCGAAVSLYPVVFGSQPP